MRAATERYDAERAERAEQRARELLRSCIAAEDWAIYDTFGFLRVCARAIRRPTASERATTAPYAYLIYAHRPIVAYLESTLALLGEYCVAFAERLPPSDDVLAKWLALTADERTLIGAANVHPLGRQTDPARVRRDLARLAAWDSGRPGAVG